MGEQRNGGRLPGDDGYLDQLFAAFEAGSVTQGEWHRLSTLHRGLVGVAA